MPYMREQSGVFERIFRSLREECVWLHRFTDFNHSQTEVKAWIDSCNTRCPHSVLGNRSRPEYLTQNLETGPGES